VRDEDHRLRPALQDRQQLLVHEPAGLRVEGLVHQQDRGVEGDGAGDGDALLPPENAGLSHDRSSPTGRRLLNTGKIQAHGCILDAE
jgi:hypothetical protein